ncbi:DUF1576 domain-containing protein [Enterococcus hulanensis]|uniref:DUF1576 domain-containing protein n=1 Tax=Enterococcus hulanensis TaxID=2559929 RepID=A0ABU3EY58_9ENTE|nr:DUF1576 domain-containing protein [Enterococcus hulanensis]MDT2599616.1 DUF1576 domain-containing protein [Enterococcus hulanensis]MDT2609528.1 DUF1576 domain-containing protein [Enterococcus hulanensis]MDT2616105.1 DUF1576 domain-containing protein [Enterococcus hulanensis]MDT2627855.1 DUF1576 domain-containing protein [Enterococcus hulanensis]MDT2654960.1 DUF1576 domain-containing protein [Enterococcus hulanensis]
MGKTKQVLLSTDIIFIFLLTYGLSITLAAFFLASPEKLISGMEEIVRSPSNLITDYVHIAGVGAAFLNSGLVTLSSLFLLRKHKHHFCSLTVSVIMMLSGFSFFGKNIVNSAPIILGCLIYLRIHHSGRQDLLVMGLLSTCLSPIVSTIYCAPDHSAISNKFIALVAGLLIGYTILPIFEFLKVHTKELNLYNMGFSAGFIGVIGNLTTRNILAIKIVPHDLSFEHHHALLIFLAALFTLPFLVFLYFYKKNIDRSKHLFLDLKKIARFSLYGYLAVIFTLLLKVPLSGILVGAILTFAGFSMYNFKFRYFFFPALGVFLTALLLYRDAATTNNIVIILFASTLSPMTRKYGLVTGTLSGALFSLITRNTQYLTAGINLYNCGFAGGITVLLMDFVRVSFYRNTKIKAYCQNAHLRIIQFEKDLLAKFQVFTQSFLFKITTMKDNQS